MRLAGRLDGAEIARKEWLAKGRMPLTNLRADIDYGEATLSRLSGPSASKFGFIKEKCLMKNRK